MYPFTHWLKHWTGHSPRNARRKRSFRRLNLEQLEDRLVPANPAVNLDLVPTTLVATALVTPTGTTVTHDETAGLQNSTITPSPAGDANDDDVLFSSIPSAFSTRLSALTSATPIGAAESDGNVVDFNPTGTLGNIALTDANGAPLNGTNSGLDTTDGQDIFLFTDTNDNIVLGKTQSGALVFAIYLEETGTPVTGGKLWTVQYKALAHPDGGDPDDAVDLTGLVHVTASESQSFSFAGAPSGQNLFMMFGNSSQSIVVTGRDPANQSAGESITTGDTVNTGQGGGATTLGTNGQQIKAQKGMYFTFVTGANSDVTVPNLSQTAADVESNIDFTGVLGATAAQFTIAQTSPAHTTLTIKISAFTTDAEPGTGFVDGLGDTDDVPVNITSVQINGVAVVPANLNLDGDTAIVSGVKAGDVITYTTDGSHNRVLIENNQSATGAGSNKTFDIGGFALTQVAGDTEEVGSKIFFEDDGPDVAAKNVAGPTATLDESPLAPNGDGVNLVTLTAATVAGLFETPSPGADGLGSLSYTLSGTDNAQTGLWLTGKSAAADEVRLVKVSDTKWEGHEGGTGGTLAFTVAIDSSTGAVTVSRSTATLEHAVDGSDATAYDDALTLASSANLFVVQHIVDGDGDTDLATAANPLTIKFEDDGPSVDLALNGTPTLTVDETTLGTPASAPAATLFTTSAAFGADGAAASNSSVWSLAVSSSGADSGLDDVATGSDILLFQNGPASVVGKVGSAAGAVAFTVSIDAATGAVTLTQARALKHPNTSDPDDVVSMASGLISVARTVTDKDGDSAAKSSSISQILRFKDDGPSLTVNDASGTFSVGAQGTWSEDPGADGFKSLSVTLNSYKIDGRDAVTVNTSLTKTGDFAFKGSITDDFNGDGSSETVEFTLTFNPNDGTYDFQMTTPPTTVITFDTTQGSLAPGGPDAVQTLLLPDPDKNIVFFGVVATAPKTGGAGATDDILDLVGNGATDLTESQIEALFPIPNLINSSTQMNVSTAGIGLNNNNLDGATAGIQSGDESFVVNPKTLVDKVTVFIDNSVGGYNPATEQLYYTVYYDDGSVGPTTLVTAGMLKDVTTGVAKGGKSFDIDAGDKKIDAVQLTMGQGTIKIPEIQFAVEQTFNPLPLDLNFTATLADKDSDTSQDPFAIHLEQPISP